MASLIDRLQGTNALAFTRGSSDLDLRNDLRQDVASNKGILDFLFGNGEDIKSSCVHPSSMRFNGDGTASGTVSFERRNGNSGTVDATFYPAGSSRITHEDLGAARPVDVYRTQLDEDTSVSVYYSNETGRWYAPPSRICD